MEFKDCSSHVLLRDSFRFVPILDFDMSLSNYDKMLDRWLLDDDVQQLLAYMLAFPRADHQRKLGDLIPGGVIALHVAALVRLSELKRFRLRSGRWSESFTANRAVALHCWLFHFFGGFNAKLEPPPQPTCNDVSTRVRDGATAAAAKLRARHDALRLRLSRSELSPDAFDTAVTGFTSAHVDPQYLRFPNKSSNQNTSAGGGGSTPPPGSEAEWQHQTDCLIAFAMGTHARLGEGYAHMEGPCAVFLLAGNFDMLRQIAARFRGVRPRKLAPPDREQLRLRQLNWRLELELQSERTYSHSLSAAAADSQRATAHALTREAVIAAKMQRCQERCQRQLEQQERAHRGELTPLNQANSALRSEVRPLLSRTYPSTTPAHHTAPHHTTTLTHQASAERRAHNKMINEMQTNHEAELEMYEADTIDRLREQEHELREYQQRMFHERNEAAEEAAELAERVEELSTTLERLRSASKSGLLTQVAELQAKVRALGARRTLNQRRLGDANLADQRTKAAQAQAAAARAALKEYGVSAEAEQVAAERADALEKQATPPHPTPPHPTPPHPTPPHTTPHHTTPHHTTSPHDTTPHHTPHHTAPVWWAGCRAAGST